MLIRYYYQKLSTCYKKNMNFISLQCISTVLRNIISSKEQMRLTNLQIQKITRLEPSDHDARSKMQYKRESSGQHNVLASTSCLARGRDRVRAPFVPRVFFVYARIPRSRHACGRAASASALVAPRSFIYITKCHRFSLTYIFHRISPSDRQNSDTSLR